MTISSQPESAQTPVSATQDAKSDLAVLDPVSVRCKGVLFDMDGILISSIGSVERSWTTWARARNLDVAEAIHTAHGQRAIETIRILRPDLDDLAELKFIEDLECADKEGLAVLPGILNLLNSLPTHRWTVVTSATERLARIRLAEGGIPVPAQFVTADHVTNGKPDPEPFERGAVLLGFPPSECVVFEDSASGSKAGRAAGCTVICTLFSHKIEELGAAHYIVTDLTGITIEVLPGDEGLALHFVPFAVQS